MDEDYSSNFTDTAVSPEVSLNTLVENNLYAAEDREDHEESSVVHDMRVSIVSDLKLVMVQEDTQLGAGNRVIILNSPKPLTVTLPPLQLGTSSVTVDIKALGASYIDHYVIPSSGNNINFNSHGYLLRSPKSVTFWSYGSTWIPSD